MDFSKQLITLLLVIVYVVHEVTTIPISWSDYRRNMQKPIFHPKVVKTRRTLPTIYVKATTPSADLNVASTEQDETTGKVTIRFDGIEPTTSTFTTDSNLLNTGTSVTEDATLDDIQVTDINDQNTLQTPTVGRTSAESLVLNTTSDPNQLQNASRPQNGTRVTSHQMPSYGQVNMTSAQTPDKVDETLDHRIPNPTEDKSPEESGTNATEIQPTVVSYPSPLQTEANVIQNETQATDDLRNNGTTHMAESELSAVQRGVNLTSGQDVEPNQRHERVETNQPLIYEKYNQQATNEGSPNQDQTENFPSEANATQNETQATNDLRINKTMNMVESELSPVQSGLNLTSDQDEGPIKRHRVETNQPVLYEKDDQQATNEGSPNQVQTENIPNVYQPASSSPNVDQNATLTCKEPQSTDLQANYSRLHEAHDVTIQPKESQRTILSTEDLFNEHCRETYPAPYKNNTCSRELLGLAYGEVNEMSLCPWTYVRHYNSQRYPPTMMFAQCECPHCIEGDQFSVSNYCRPVYANMKVLVRGECHNGVYWYTPAYEKVPVACVCARPNDRMS